MLIFFSNELSTREQLDSLRLPATFIGFAYVQGKLYKHYRSNSSFVIPSSIGRTWGNSVVYGTIWHVNDWIFYSRIVDAYHSNSLSTIGINHKFDVHHRINSMATPIHFASLDDFRRLKYREGQSVSVQMYVGNPNHPKINQRIKRSTHSYRIIDGLDAKHFIQRYREAQHES